MTDDDKARPPRREYAQLLRLSERLLGQLESIRDELGSGPTTDLLHEIRNRTGSSPELSGAVSAIEQAMRALKLTESEVRKAIFDTPQGLQVEGAPNLPAHLQRFLAERASMSDFQYDVTQDPVRGWIICWKEYTEKGTVRGYGQISERPYAWIED